MLDSHAAITMKCHGIHYDSDSSGRYYFGLKSLIDSFSIPPELSGIAISVSDRNRARRFKRNSFYYLNNKYRDTFLKFNTAVTRVGRLIPITQQECHDQQPMEEFVRWSTATEDILFYLDSLVAYFRILADVTAKIIPFFYETTEKIPTRSFRDQQTWITKTRPQFDHIYSEILLSHTEWFDIIAGKSPKGIRDLHFHHDAILQLGWQVLEYPDHTIRVTNISQIGSQSTHDFRFLPRIINAIRSFYEFNDAIFNHFNYVLTEQFSFFKGIDKEHTVFRNFTITDARTHYSLLPTIEPH